MSKPQYRSAKTTQAFAIERWMPCAIILVFSLVLSIPLFRDGLPYGHDTEEHLERYVCFAGQIAHGELYPRWLEKANGGLGSPVMFVYAPLAYYVPAVLRPVLNFRQDGSTESRELGVSLWLAMAISGLTAFLWLRTFVNNVWATTAGALLYLLLPYHFEIDLYTRAAVSEVWAFAWMPLILYFGCMTIRNRSLLSAIGLAVSYALLIYTHLLTTLIFTPVLLGAAFVWAKKGAYRAALLRIVLALGLGAGLSSAYLLPALQQEKYVSPERLGQYRPTLSYPLNFVAFRRDLADPAHRGDYLWKLSLITFSTVAAAAIAFTLKRGSKDKASAQDYYWALVALASFAMMLPLSTFIWKAIPQLAAIQFPYRFNTLVCLAVTALLASAAGSLLRPFRGWRIPFAIALAGIGLFWAAADITTVAHLAPGKPRSLPRLAETPMVLDVLLPGWGSARNPVYLKNVGILELSHEWAAHGDNPAQASSARPNARTLELSVNGSPGWVTVPLLYYPGWTARSEHGESLQIRPVPENGLVEVEAPAGLNRIIVSLPVGPAEKAALAATGASALLTLLLLAWAYRERRTNGAPLSGRAEFSRTAAGF